LKKANGTYYKGNWAKDERNGEGVETYPDGSLYIGSFTNNEKHGTGTYEKEDGRCVKGEWVRGKYKKDSEKCDFMLDDDK